MPTAARLTVDSKVPGSRIDQIWSTQGGWREDLSLLAANAAGLTIPWPANQLYCLMLFQPPGTATSAVITVKYQSADTGLQFPIAQNQDPQPILIPKPNSSQFIILVTGNDLTANLYFF
jgi:hypothetical protein